MGAASKLGRLHRKHSSSVGSWRFISALIPAESSLCKTLINAVVLVLADA